MAHGGGGCTAANFCKSAYLRGGSRLEGRQPQPWARLEPRAPLKGSTHKEGFDGGCAPELPKFTSGAWGGAELINYGVNHRGVEGVGVARVARCRRCRGVGGVEGFTKADLSNALPWPRWLQLVNYHSHALPSVMQLILCASPNPASPFRARYW